MKLLLNNFESFIDKKIVERGRDYYMNDAVQDLEMTLDGGYRASVAGSDDYSIEIHIEGQQITAWDCDCPYDMGPICKHVVAVFFKIREDEVDAVVDPRMQQELGTMKKKKDELLDLLGRVPEEDLRKFVYETAKSNEEFKFLFLNAFSSLYGQGQSKETYEKQIDHFVDEVSGRDGYIVWNKTSTLVRKVNDLFQTAEKLSSANKSLEAFTIYTAICEKMYEAMLCADDSSGEIGGCVSEALLALENLSQNGDNAVKKKIFEYCINLFKKGTFSGWDWHSDLIHIASSLTNNQQEADLIISLVDTEIARSSEYSKGSFQEIKYDLLRKHKNAELAEQYLMDNLQNSSFRRKAIDAAFNNNDYEKAKQFALDGIQADADKRGLVSDWTDCLLRVAQAQNDKEKIIQLSKELFIECFRRNKDYYSILKSQFEQDDWIVYAQKVVDEIKKSKSYSKDDLLRHIYADLENWTGMMELLRQSPGLNNFDTYEKYVLKDFREEYLNLYFKELKRFADVNVNRESYKQVARHLKHLQSLDAKKQVAETVVFFRQTYKLRRAMMEELARF